MNSPWLASRSRDRDQGVRSSDVCLIAEGCYPYVRGGVSSWIDWLMRSCSELRFSVVAIVASGTERKVQYEFPPNLVEFRELELHAPPSKLQWLPSDFSNHFANEISTELVAFMKDGKLASLAELRRLLRQSGSRELDALLASGLGWETVRGTYYRLMPEASFLHFYWAWRALCGGLFAVLQAPLPNARAYHAISTGYAGLLAANATLVTHRPAILTEHGIYTNERRIEIAMASWIATTIDKGLTIGDPRLDLRDLWVMAFDAYARCCYEACSTITTLYSENQILQRDLGADPARMRVIANGIVLKRFSSLERAGPSTEPTVALIGRVVPIKDVKTFIMAAGKAREKISRLRALVIGPTDEDPQYFAECRSLVEELGLTECVAFTGNVDITKYLPIVHVIALTSLSEAQPLVLLEGGAAGIPCVSTDVGSCREILEGRPEEDPPCGPGGIVCPLVNADATADAFVRLLLDGDLREKMGAALKSRVQRYYETEKAAAAYRDLYKSAIELPDIIAS
jgi:polysaccharide biosynthesis protein PelF